MKINRTVAEYWELSPAQVAFIIEQHAEKKSTKGGLGHLKSMQAQTSR